MAKRVMPRVNELLRQKVTEKSSYDVGLSRMKQIAGSMN